MERIRITHVLLVIGFVVIVAVIGGLVLSYVEAGHYNEKIRHATSELNTQFKLLEKSTERSLLDDPDTPITTVQKDTTTIKSIIEKSHQAIDELDTTSTTLELPIHIGVNDETRRAPVLQQESQALVTQTKNALDKYEKILVFLEDYTTHWHAVQAHLNTFNAQTDLNIYAGRGNDLRAVADDIRRQARELQAANTPHEFRELVGKSIAAMNKSAEGFDNLARGIDLAVDSVIYSSATTIEEASRELETINQTSYGPAIQGSRIVKEIGELTEKLDPLLTAETSRF